jgi:hypothetical protein
MKRGVEVVSACINLGALLIFVVEGRPSLLIDTAALSETDDARPMQAKSLGWSR